MTYTVLLAEQPHEILDQADTKTERIVKEKLRALADEPHPRPGAGIGGRERITVDDRDVVWYDIGRSFTAYYTIDEADSAVEAREILPIDVAHKRYD